MSLAVYDKLLADLAVRCGVNDATVLRKSKELIALLGSKQVNCTETCKVVVCLELASSLSSSPLKREEAIKYSGCKKKVYVNIFNIISKLLNLDKIYSVKEVSLLVGASDVHVIAKKLLDKYQGSNAENDADYEHPMYVCCAVLVACRINKIQCNFSKLVDISRIKKSELEHLASEFQKLVDVKTEKVKGNKKRNNLDISGAHQNENDEKPKREKTESEKKKMTDEEYAEWKRRMLED